VIIVGVYLSIVEAFAEPMSGYQKVVFD
jgi:hypothetical protein